MAKAIPDGYSTITPYLTMSDAAKAIFNLARFSNYLYTTSQDDRWYTAGKSLYRIKTTTRGFAAYWPEEK